LALGAIEGRTPALDDSSDGATASAGLTLAIIDGEGLGEVAQLTVGADEILERRAARFDRLIEYVVDGRNELPQPVERDRTARPPRVDAGAIERFAHIYIAKAGDDALVEQEEFDRRSPPLEPAMKLFCCQVERLRAERGEHWPFVKLIGFDDVERTEPASIIQRHAAALIGLKHKMVVLAELARIDAPVTRHAEVENQAVSAVGIDDTVFGPAAKADDGRSGQPLTEIDRKRATKVCPPRFHALQPAASQDLGEATNGRFNFGKLRHAHDMADAS